MSKILETASSLSGPRSEEAGAHSNPGSLLPFVYEPLDLEKQVFRLIRVQKREGNGPIEIEMWHSEMSTQYRCLSYMWGEETQTYGLLLNGKSFGVRKNLYHFLEFASRVYPEETLWIDAICIDQTNIAERGHQVQRMGAIYSKADEVLVWLSECRAFLKSKFGEWSDVKRLTKSPDCVQLECYPDDDEQMAQLCSNPYWNRAWIAQEILLQRNVRILFNGHDLFMPWPSLGNALPRTPDWQTKTTPQLSMVRGLLNTWYERHGHSIADMSEMKWNRALSIRPNQTITPSIWDLLATRATAACSDSRDRVYSLVALLHQEANQRLVVDYGENKSDFLLRLLTTLKGWHIPGRIALLICALDLSVDTWKSSILLKCQHDFKVTLDVNFVWHVPALSPNACTAEERSWLRNTRSCQNYGCGILGESASDKEAIYLCTGSLPFTPEESLKLSDRGTDETISIHFIVHYKADRSDGPIEVALLSSPSIWLPTSSLPLKDYALRFSKQDSIWKESCTWADLKEHISSTQGDIHWQIRVPVLSLFEALRSRVSNEVDVLRKRGEITGT